MASGVPVLSEEQLLCPICLGLLVKPVSTPCGHNFCMSCLSSYWDSSPVCLCPVCKESFSLRPQLRVNTFISGLSQSFMKQPLSEEEARTRELRAELGGTEAQISSMIQERLEKVSSVRQALAQRRRETKRVANAVEELVSLVRAMEEKQKDVDSEAGKAVEQIEHELAELMETQTQLKTLELKDAQVFLQNRSKTIERKPVEISSDSELEMQELKKSLHRSLTKLQDCLDKMAALSLSDAADLKHARQFAIEVTLDPKTAHPRLVLSKDLKQVWFNPDASSARASSASNTATARFAKHLAVLGVRGVRSGQAYFEVGVGNKTEWIVGVALASLQRKSKIPHAPGCGVFAVCFRRDYFETFCRPGVPFYRGGTERVGVFVDYEARRVAFYDVAAAKAIHAFEKCEFAGEKVFPYFNPCNDEFEGNLGPLALVPVDPGC